MIRRLCVLLVCAPALIAVLAGCGGGGSTTTTSTKAKHATKTTATSTVPLSLKLRTAVIACKKEVATNAYIAAADKPAGEADCAGVKSGNVGQVTALRAILKNACLLKVTDKVPAAEQAAAMAACKKYF
jgi:hypothetical protein